MSEKFTIADLLTNLRAQLLTAIEQKDRVNIAELKTTFTILREASYTSQDEKLIGIIVALEDSARDGVEEFYWKSDLPSSDMIRSLLSNKD